MTEDMLYVALGLAAGILSGLIGIGGGGVIVPALVFLFGFTQHQAQGTTLAPEHTGKMICKECGAIFPAEQDPPE